MKDKEAALAVKEAQNRVKSMVLIHQNCTAKTN
jgi:two-component sensor histidine kinase